MKPNRPVFVVLNARSGRRAVRERIESLRAGFRAASGREPRLFVARSGKHLAGIATDSSRPPRDGDFFAVPSLEEFRAGTEREFIRRKLEENGGNIKRTAERIGIQRSNLYKKLERYGLK